MLACTFQPVLEEKSKLTIKWLEEYLSWDYKEKKIDEDETEPGNLKISVALIYIAHDQLCKVSKVDVHCHFFFIVPHVSVVSRFGVQFV